MLPTECMKEIFQYIKKNDESLYPSLLVNRYWCKNVVTLLWACPFDPLNFDNVYMITSVYISFLEEHEKNQLKIFYDQKSIPKLIPREKLLFNYPMMLEKFSIKNLGRIVHTWIAKFCPDKKSKKQVMQIKKQIILLLFQLFIKSTNLKFLRLNSDNIMNVLEFQPEISQDLNITKLAIEYNQISIYTIKLLEKISKSCKKINYLIVKVPAFENNPEIKNSIISIINAQEKLKEFNFRGVDSWVDEIIKALQFQANSLISIKLEEADARQNLIRPTHKGSTNYNHKRPTSNIQNSQAHNINQHPPNMFLDNNIMDRKDPKIEDSINEAKTMMTIASLSLRSCYVNNASSIPSFIELRRSVTNDAKVYCKKVMPFSRQVIKNMKQFLENYNTFTFEKFKKYLPDLAEEAKHNVEVCRYTLELHKSLLTDLKTTRDKAVRVIGELILESQLLEQKKENFKRKHDIAAAFAIGLAIIPYVNLIAAPILGFVAHNFKQDEIAAKEESMLAVAAADCIQGPLIESVEKFISAITNVAGFLENLAGDLTMLSDDHRDNPKRMHYDRVKAKASDIAIACHLFMSSIPDYETNLRAIPDENSQNYVQVWLSKKKVEGGKSFIDWGLELFRSNNEIVMLLEGPNY
ncbi:41947_t:CDS:2 [Gigaspora margarita]|uniref:41947_t:CDS:1 n=1 Tax=Gigaspora margarita TaxID=4874 RepID=A0ABN7UFD2_GIGMA|nr:41947_t:CDS:2 [Gigaspora margarita]